MEYQDISIDIDLIIIPKTNRFFGIIILIFLVFCLLVFIYVYRLENISSQNISDIDILKDEFDWSKIISPIVQD